MLFVVEERIHRLSLHTGLAWPGPTKGNLLLNYTTKQTSFLVSSNMDLAVYWVVP